MDEEAAAFLGRAYYGKTPLARGYRNGTRPRRVQTAALDLVIAGARSRGLSGLDHRELERLRKERQVDQTEVALTA